MHTEHTMIKNAAIAVGYIVDDFSMQVNKGVWVYRTTDVKDRTGKYHTFHWNPLYNSADSFHLAVALDIFNSGNFTTAQDALYTLGVLPSDPIMAARLTILFIASTIGEQLMKETVGE